MVGACLFNTIPSGSLACTVIMPMLNGEYYADSLLLNVPLIGEIEKRSDARSLRRWLADYSWLSVVVVAVYLLCLFGGTRYMKNKSPYVMRRSLFLWNVGLAVFSAFGTLSTLPNLLDVFVKKGFVYSACNTAMYDDAPLMLWTWLFTVSKVIELGDTFFLVAKKTPVQCLHWYHHSTVLVYTWFGSSSGSSHGHWFGVMNFVVHSVMYTYFAVRASGTRVPAWTSKAVTTLQITQMFIGLAVNMAVLSAFQGGQECRVNPNILYTGFAIYASYTVLFLHFFYHRYIRKAEKKSN